MYGFIDISDFDTILKTWRSTDIPPNPSKKLVRIMLIEIFFNLIEDIKFIPFVISSIPVKSEPTSWDGILSFEQIGVKNKSIIVINLLEFNIEIITENKTTNPPTIKTVFVADFILFTRISPRLEKDTFCNLFSSFDVLYFLNVLDLLFQNLNKKPTLIAPKICVTNNKNPITELPNKLIPHIPTIKRGPELFVKLSNLSQSSFEHILVSLKFTAILAPIGYPTKPSHN